MTLNYLPNNINMHRLAVIISICLLIGLPAFAQKGKKPAVLKKDSSSVSIKQLDKNAVKQYAADPEFSYAEEKPAEHSLWDGFWYWFWKWIDNALANTGLSHPSIKYILTGLAAIGVLFLILKSAKLLRRDAKKADVPYQETLENIHEIDFDTAIDNAIATRNFRLAVRLQYLKCLKQLSDAGLIQWEIDKTNTAYYYELNNPVQREAFGLVTRRFEYVWYGDFHIDEQVFEHINRLFQQFKTKL